MNERNQTTLATEQTLFARLDALGIEHDTFRHQALHTVEESQAARGEMGESEGGHCKNLFLKDKKVVFWLFVTLEEKRVNMNVLQKTLGAARLSFGKPEFMKEYLGVEPGSVTPFAAINQSSLKVQFVLDEEMLTHNRLHYHPLHNAATTRIKSQDLLYFLKDCGHDVRVISI
ncbi:MAG: prolyl-tRNA synthetase associated domain-containing protein [Rhodospirillaceae bacterium]|nr:prolyl-tRNA synthetase associated domain-containing protein [Rhodospirillaceae bacterium]MBT4588260.1 prolyl-tRNA synthetase associated domain-containing protein [Rhodospirillaceae bacterium]MBT4938552.1 prolyl-tRNA synthetase associated domain-containing protein [Rhodospirillaceae bacterium]MBT7269198.1 prolyl-tRNA synthetase associated domain-containing protein [Rhodospirillaceae bacterium]